jgi:hypothetical protein
MPPACGPPRQPQPHHSLLCEGQPGSSTSEKRTFQPRFALSRNAARIHNLCAAYAYAVSRKLPATGERINDSRHAAIDHGIASRPKSRHFAENRSKTAA